jgi:hypothetical protein
LASAIINHGGDPDFIRNFVWTAVRIRGDNHLGFDLFTVGRVSMISPADVVVAAIAVFLENPSVSYIPPVVPFL